MSYHKEHAIPYKVYIVCDWCKKRSFLYSALSETTSERHKHYYPVGKVVSNRKQLLVKDCHMCSICIDDHTPFFWIKNGLVYYGEFTPEKNK
jgi:hypothetical protein